MKGNRFFILLQMYLLGLQVLPVFWKAGTFFAFFFCSATFQKQIHPTLWMGDWGIFHLVHTSNNELLTLKMILRRLTESKILRNNPALGAKQLKANERSFHVISNDKEKLYLLAAPQPLQDVAVLMFETGMICAKCTN